MTPWLADLSKEIIVAGLTAAFTWICHYVVRLAKDLNHSFEKLRCMDVRIANLEDDNSSLWSHIKNLEEIINERDVT